MVDETGQLYTIEGISAAMIMLFTTYLVLGATSVYTPGDTHISDMQLEQIGNDALNMMNTPVNGTAKSDLVKIVENDDTFSFNTTFLNYINSRTGSNSDNLHYSAEVTYNDIANSTTGEYFLASNRNLTGGEHPVRVTKWVIVDKTLPSGPYPPKKRAVLVEVLLWRD